MVHASCFILHTVEYDYQVLNTRIPAQFDDFLQTTHPMRSTVSFIHSLRRLRFLVSTLDFCCVNVSHKLCALFTIDYSNPIESIAFIPFEQVIYHLVASNKGGEKIHTHAYSHMPCLYTHTRTHILLIDSNFFIQLNTFFHMLHSFASNFCFNACFKETRRAFIMSFARSSYPNECIHSYR